LTWGFLFLESSSQFYKAFPSFLWQKQCILLLCLQTTIGKKSWINVFEGKMTHHCCLFVHIYNTFLKSTITKLPRSRAFMNFQDTFSKWNAHKDGNTNEETNNAQTKHECCFDLQPSMFTNYTHSLRKKEVCARWNFPCKTWNI
jgi:hypothetical protein